MHVYYYDSKRSVHFDLLWTPHTTHLVTMVDAMHLIFTCIAFHAHLHIYGLSLSMYQQFLEVSVGQSAFIAVCAYHLILTLHSSQ